MREHDKKEAPPGFEPGLADLQSAGRKSQRKKTKGVAETAEKTLAHSLAHEIEKDPALARLIRAWPGLAGPIKRAMLAMLEAGQGGK